MCRQCQQEKAKDTTNKNKYSELGPSIVGEAKSAVDDLQDLQQKPETKISLSDRIAMLNANQSRVFHRVSNHLNHQYHHETVACKCKDCYPLHVFVSGVDGTGKSFLFEAIRAQADAIWSLQSYDSLVCTVAAPTGLAAISVGDVTLYRLFQLPIEHDVREQDTGHCRRKCKSFYDTHSVV